MSNEVRMTGSFQNKTATLPAGREESQARRIGLMRVSWLRMK